MASTACSLAPSGFGRRLNKASSSNAAHRLPMRRCMRVSAEKDPGKVVREFSEETGKVADSAKEQIKSAAPKSSGMSPELKQKMRNEYIGLGGSPEQPPSTNWFVLISVVIAVLALLSKAAGYI